MVEKGEERVAWERVESGPSPPPPQQPAGSRRSARKPKTKGVDTEESSDPPITLGEAAKKVWETVEFVDMLARPWLRVDASLNRKIFDRMLGAVLGYVMQRPGQPMAHTADRFTPAIQPYQTRELLEILQVCQDGWCIISVQS